MSDPLTGPAEECEAALAVASARVGRLLGEVFTDGERAARVLDAMLKTRGLEDTLRVVMARDSLRHAWSFGSTRDSLWLLGRRQPVGRALEELPQAIRDRQALTERLADLRQARTVLLEREDTERRWTRAAERRPTDRERTRE